MGFLAAFCVLAIVNKTAIMALCGFSCEYKFSVPLDKYQEAGLLGVYQDYVYFYKKLCNCFPELLYHFTFPAVLEWSGFSASLLMLGVVIFFFLEGSFSQFFYCVNMYITTFTIFTVFKCAVQWC